MSAHVCWLGDMADVNMFWESPVFLPVTPPISEVLGV